MATSNISSSSNTERQSELALLKRIKTEQTFSNQVYANFQSLRFGIDACCYENYDSAVMNKELCDWQNAASSKIVVASGTKGVFVEPLKKINTAASMSCPEVPTNVCTIVDLETILADAGTYTQCFDVASSSWTVTHNLGKFPSVTVVDSTNTIVVGDTVYTDSNTINLTFQTAFRGCVFLN
jgi:hypothetical protein